MTCAECTHWRRYGGDYIVRHLEKVRPWGECLRADADDALMRGRDDDAHNLETHETFGCVMFEPKEPV